MSEKFQADMSDRDRAMHAEGLEGVAQTATALATALRARDDASAVVHLTLLALSTRPISMLLDEFVIGVVLERMRARTKYPAPAAPEREPAAAAAQ